MTDDVVAELDAWPGDQMLHPDLVQRARDEIVQLRKALHAEMMGRPDKWHAFIAEARDEALEEAARVCVGSGATVAEARLCASAIRALKEKRDD